MAEENPKEGSVWSDQELEAAVIAFVDFLQRSKQGEKLAKNQLYRDVAKATGRTEKSVDYRMRNISAVYEKMGRGWVKGFAPAT